MHVMATNHQSVFSDMNITVAYCSFSKDMTATLTQCYICVVFTDGLFLPYGKWAAGVIILIRFS